ncbi:unnamed protein product [[Candida] boidinii]|uniref:Unnamed protein product n=1 Tax=Candida boidinii TaxID=5477 RepID=A0ACB5U2V9_CANBO|nr:unnamed protein product [[Candida] boidinii]
MMLSIITITIIIIIIQILQLQFQQLQAQLKIQSQLQTHLQQQQQQQQQSQQSSEIGNFPIFDSFSNDLSKTLPLATTPLLQQQAHIFTGSSSPGYTPSLLSGSNFSVSSKRSSFSSNSNDSPNPNPYHQLSKLNASSTTNNINININQSPDLFSKAYLLDEIDPSQQQQQQEQQQQPSSSSSTTITPTLPGTSSSSSFAFTYTDDLDRLRKEADLDQFDNSIINIAKDSIISNNQKFPSSRYPYPSNFNSSSIHSTKKNYDRTINPREIISDYSISTNLNDLQSQNNDNNSSLIPHTNDNKSFGNESESIKFK